MEDEKEALLWVILICIQRAQFDRVVSNRKGVSLSEYQMNYIIEFVVQGNYEEEIVEKIFGLSSTLQALIKTQCLN